jgi:cytochrome c peroxidase
MKYKVSFIVLLLVLAVVIYSFVENERPVTILTEVNEEYFNLSSHCPPGFMLNENNECVSRNLYQQYKYKEPKSNTGVGGLKTALPELREGFSPQQIDLGRYLFFDPVLSGDGSVACASCHNPNQGFSDGKALGKGIHSAKMKRSSPTLWNVGYLKKLFWDARAGSLEEQMQGPLYSEEEMGTTEEQLLSTLNTIDEYKELFGVAFPQREKTDNINIGEIYTSIAAFESSLISLNSRYDQYAHGFHNALNENEIKGLNIFRSFVARCAECHTPPLFTNQQIAVIGSPEPDGLPFDPGAEITFKDSTRRGGFKVPTLRNIEKTAPYMHSGKFASMRETVEFYTKGRGHAVPENEELFIHWHIWEPNLTDTELDRLVDFLKTLTDESFKPRVPKRVPSGIHLQQLES